VRFFGFILFETDACGASAAGLLDLGLRDVAAGVIDE
jgi:hypothetical protein